jgi:uncharacterized nucleotidyltransferase DUF6036
MIEPFLLDLDKDWRALGDEPIVLSVIGSTALFLQTDYERGTKDTDFLEIEEISKENSGALLKLGGEDSPLHKKHRLFIQIIKRPIPFLPPHPTFIDLNSLRLNNFRIRVLDVVDVVVSKLKPFRTKDLDDIREMVKRQLIDPDKLVDRFILTKERWLLDGRAGELKTYVENLHEVQREFLRVPETPIDLPDWLEEI